MVAAVDKAKSPRWLFAFYRRTQADADTSLRRRDNATNWSYVVMAAVVGTYAGFFADGSGVPPLGRFGLVAGALIVLSRFFFMSAIAYGFYRRSRYFRDRIEKHWIGGAPSLKEITSDIAKYEHERSAPPAGRGPFAAQVRSGAVITLVAPSILLLYELSLGHGWEHCLILAGLAGYAALEAFNYATYGQIHPPRNGGGGG